MKCLICGREYINLGVHLRHKHAIDPDDYREEFGILRVAPLVDAESSRHLSDSAKRRLKDPEYKSEMAAICKANAAANIGTARVMSKAGKEALAKRNIDANKKYLQKQAPVVAKILSEKKTFIDVRRAIGMGHSAAKKIVAMGEASYSPDISALVATQRRIASRQRNKASTKL